MVQGIAVIKVLIAERKADHTLADKGRQFMLDQRLTAAVLKACGEAADKVDGAIGGTQEQRAGIRRDGAAVKGRLQTAALNGWKTEQVRVTLCWHQGAPLSRRKSLRHNNFTLIRAPVHPPSVRYPG